MLETIEVETAAKPTAAVIWLHGLGADGHDFEPIVPEIVHRGERAWRFVFPNAPVRPVTINGGMAMRAWYDITGFDRMAEEDIAGFRDTDNLVRQLIAREVERGIAIHRIVLAGFSQGGAVSLYTVPRLPGNAGGRDGAVLLPAADRLSFAAERAPANDATPIFMAHGLADNVLPFGLGAAVARFPQGKKGYAVEWHDYPMAHAVCAAEIADIREIPDPRSCRKSTSEKHGLRGPAGR
jgi:phospholipase/carboxylesterase